MLYVSPKGFLQGRISTGKETFILEQAFRHFKYLLFLNPLMHRDSRADSVEEYTVVYREQDLKNKYDPHSARNESGHSFCGVDESELPREHGEEVRS